MTPQERQLISDLFDRLAQLEAAPRDSEAERAIAEGLQRAPHALYPLVQTALVQDEALKRANARIQELEAELGDAPEPAPSGGFLDSMRDKLLGRQDAPRGSVPTVRPGASPDPRWGGAAQDQRWTDSRGYQDAQYQQPAAPMPGSGGGGGSFLGTAASAAAGVIGGALLLDGIRSMFGHSGSAHAGAFDPGLSGATPSSPWGSDSNSDLARQAGLDDISQSTGAGGGNEPAGLFDASDTDTDSADSSYDADDFSDSTDT